MNRVFLIWHRNSQKFHLLHFWKLNTLERSHHPAIRHISIFPIPAPDGTVIGVIESMQSRIFDPFFTTKPVGKGTGLGLSISHRVVTKQHQGQLKCISAPGQGTEFAIEIPLPQGKN